jgi:ATP-binding cassette subfamily C (CFTR/MRP) protein 4
LGEIARGWRETNTAIVAVERISEYIALEPEAAWRSKRPRNWPSQGRITFQDFSFRYRPTSEPILHELNFEINPGEKVGIVGRTGAGSTYKLFYK